MSSINTNRSSKSGFTIVEMLIIAPMIILLIGGIIAFIVSIVGDTLMSSERNTIAWQVQSSLDQIENDIRIATSINGNTGTMPTPQGSDNAVAAFDSSNSLLLTQYATTANPYNTSRQLIYLANPASTCGTNSQYLNPTLTIQVIYFISNGNLYRRVSYPPVTSGSTCGGATPWQINSCSAIGASPCFSKDQLMLPSAAMTIQYYTGTSTTSSSTAAANLTTSARVTLSSTRTIAGSSISGSGVMRATRLNSSQ